MRNAPLRCSSKATNVCMRRGFELKTCEGIWPIGLQKVVCQHTGWLLKANSYRKKKTLRKCTLAARLRGIARCCTHVGTHTVHRAVF